MPAVFTTAFHFLLFCQNAAAKCSQVTVPKAEEREADTCYRIDPPRFGPSLYALGELLSEDQVLGADRRR